MKEWKNVKQELPELNKKVIFFQPSTEKYFVGYLHKEETGDRRITNGGIENLFILYWVTSTGKVRDMEDSDVWMPFSFYSSHKTFE